MGVLGQLLTKSTSAELLMRATEEIVISTIFVSENSSGAATFEISVVPYRQTYSASNDLHRLYNAAELPADATVAVTAGITLSDGDMIWVASGAAGVSFTAFGAPR